MRLRILSNKKLLIIAFVGIALSLAFLFYLINRGLTLNGSLPASLPSSQAMAGEPVRLKIPVINVDADIEYVGLDSEGAMEAPKSPDNVAWLELGQRPGDAGSAVIAGHYGWKDGKAAAFDYLYKLRKGDKLYVEDAKGAVIPFVVRESRSYSQEAGASDVFNSSDGKAHLNLITCEGIWDKVSKSYSERLVVFTDKE